MKSQHQTQEELRREASAKEPSATSTSTREKELASMARETKAEQAKVEAKTEAKEKTESKAEEIEEEEEGGEDEQRMQLVEERLAVEKIPHEAGKVRIHKAVKTEEKKFEVPLRKEEVTIERTLVEGAASEQPGTAAFKETTTEIPVYEEELRVSKKPFVREELHVRKVAHTETQRASATLRHEEVDIEDKAHCIRKEAAGGGAACAGTTASSGQPQQPVAMAAKKA